MTIKSQIKRLLGESLAVLDQSDIKNRIINKQIIKNIVLDDFTLPPELKSQSQGGFLRILATSSMNASHISTQLKKNQDDLGIKSVHIIDKPLEYYAKPKTDQFFNFSVLAKIEPKISVQSIPSPTTDDLKSQILGDGISRKRIVIDFSSPNIAKPFHFGHMKSTLLGNFLANLNTLLGNEVTKLNYIGDWGTQYGLLSLGLDQENTIMPDESPLKYILDVYVRANERGRSDENFYNEARNRFIQLENGQTELLDKWRRVRDLSLDELKNSYSQLGIEFDVYDCESNHAAKSIQLVEEMSKRGLVNKLDDGVICVEIEKNNKLIQVPLLKSDGASLYITRDIAAAISRKQQFEFNEMLYIVGSDQEKHFHSLKEIIKKLDLLWADELIHVKMGKVIGMSTRSGNFVLLSDIINEATKRYIEMTKNVPTSKATSQEHIESIGKHLALAALFVYDLRNGRTRNYEFDWDQVMLARERSGINLQTTHARLCSLLRKNASKQLEPYESMDMWDIDAIRCLEGINLISVLCELDTNLHDSFWLMDPSRIVNHALALCKVTNRARQSNWLQVLHEHDDEKARTRLSLFNCAKQHLELMIKLIGLKPLERV